MNLFALIKASPKCTQILGVNPVRFFEFGRAPQIENMPYATFQHITGTPYNALYGPASADHITTQIDVWTNSSAEAKAVSKAIRGAIENNCYITGWLGTSKEGDIFRTTFTVQYIELNNPTS